MYELKCFNEYSSIITRYSKKDFDKMLKDARLICAEHKMAYEYSFIKGGE